MLSQDFTALLNAAQNMHLIDAWKVLGSIVMVRRSDANFYVKPETLESLLRDLCAEC